MFSPPSEMISPPKEMFSPPSRPQIGQNGAPGGRMNLHPGQCLSRGDFGQYRDVNWDRRSTVIHPRSANRLTALIAVRRVILPHAAIVARDGHALPCSSAWIARIISTALPEVCAIGAFIAQRIRAMGFSGKIG